MFRRGEKVFSIFRQSSQICYINEIKKELPEFENLNESIISDVIDSSDFVTDRKFN